MIIYICPRIPPPIYGLDLLPGVCRIAGLKAVSRAEFLAVVVFKQLAFVQLFIVKKAEEINQGQCLNKRMKAPLRWSLKISRYVSACYFSLITGQIFEFSYRKYSSNQFSGNKKKLNITKPSQTLFEIA